MDIYKAAARQPEDVIIISHSVEGRHVTTISAVGMEKCFRPLRVHVLLAPVEDALGLGQAKDLQG